MQNVPSDKLYPKKLQLNKFEKILSFEIRCDGEQVIQTSMK